MIVTNVIEAAWMILVRASGYAPRKYVSIHSTGLVGAEIVIIYPKVYVKEDDDDQLAPIEASFPIAILHQLTRQMNFLCTLVLYLIERCDRKCG